MFVSFVTNSLNLMVTVCYNIGNIWFQDPRPSTQTRFSDDSPDVNPLKAQQMSIWMNSVEIIKDDDSIHFISGIANVI